jgi:hypothetical protein
LESWLGLWLESNENTGYDTYTYIFYTLLTFQVSARLASTKNFSTEVAAPNGPIPLVATVKSSDYHRQGMELPLKICTACPI